MLSYLYHKLCLGVLNNVLGIQILSASGYAKMYSRSFIYSAIFTVIFLLLLIGLFEGYGAAIAVSGESFSYVYYCSII